jgi:iron complex transport system permease protein
MPRVLTAMLVGAALAVAGATFQGLIRNPLQIRMSLARLGRALGAAIAVVIPVHFVIVEFGLLHGLAFAFALITAFVVVKLGGGGSGGSRGCC